MNHTHQGQPVQQDLDSCPFKFLTATYMRPYDVVLAAVVLHFITSFIVTVLFLNFGVNNETLIVAKRKKKSVRFNNYDHVFQLSTDTSVVTSPTSSSLGDVNYYPNHYMRDDDSFMDNASVFQENRSDQSSMSSINRNHNNRRNSPEKKSPKSGTSVDKNQNFWVHSSSHSDSIDKQTVLSDKTKSLVNAQRMSWFQRSRLKSTEIEVACLGGYRSQESGIR